MVSSGHLDGGAHGTAGRAWACGSMSKPRAGSEQPAAWRLGLGVEPGGESSFSRV